MEFPTTAPFPTIAFPLINAQCLISASSSIIHGPVMDALCATTALFAIHIFSPLCSYFEGSRLFPSSVINAPILGSTSKGYSTPSNISFAMVFSREYSSLILIDDSNIFSYLVFLYSTVTDFARFLGLSTSQPLSTDV